MLLALCGGAALLLPLSRCPAAAPCAAPCAVPPAVPAAEPVVLQRPDLFGPEGLGVGQDEGVNKAGSGYKVPDCPPMPPV